MLTLQEMCDREPSLYDALRERDSLANHVCELVARGAQYREVHAKWVRQQKRIKSLVAKALETSK